MLEDYVAHDATSLIFTHQQLDTVAKGRLGMFSGPAQLVLAAFTWTLARAVCAMSRTFRTCTPCPHLTILRQPLLSSLNQASTKSYSQRHCANKHRETGLGRTSSQEIPPVPHLAQRLAQPPPPLCTPHTHPISWANNSSSFPLPTVNERMYLTHLPSHLVLCI